MELQTLFGITLIAIALVNAIIFIKKGQLTKPLALFGWSLFSLSVFVGSFLFFIEGEFLLKFPFAFRAYAPTFFLIAPLFYLYLRNTLTNTIHVTWKDSFHLLPALGVLLSYIPIYTLDSQSRWELMNQLLANPDAIHLIGEGYIPTAWMPFLKMSSFIVYAFLSGKLLIQRWEAWKNLSSLGWLKVSVYFFAGIAFIFILFSYKQILDIREVWETQVITTFCFVSMYLLVILLNLYIGLFPEQIFTTSTFETQKTKLTLEKGRSYFHWITLFKNTSIPETSHANDYEQALSDEQFKSIDLIIRQNKLYLQKDLTLLKLSKIINISSRKLSSLIHEHTGKGYSDFINCYRASFAKEKIDEGYLNNYTIEALSDQAGFNSRVTFYNVFKKIQGVCPSDYHKRNIEGLNFS
ncbi:MAG: helix-turn-helix domain-containing protein [Mongoliitalea sp.]